MFGGVSNYWANLLKQLPDKDIVVLAPEYDNSLDFDIKQNFLIYRHKLLSNKKLIWPKWLPFLFQTWRIVRSEKIEQIIVAQVLPGGTIAYLLKKFLNIPYVLSFHGLDIALSQSRPRKRHLLKKILKHADRIIVNSQYTSHELTKVGLGNNTPVEIIYPCPNFSQKSSDQTLKDKIIREETLTDRKIIITVGRLVERKGADKTIEAVKILVSKYPKILYLIIGKGKYKNYLLNMIQMYGLSNNVRIIENITDHELPIYYELADIFVMPARRLDNGDVEGFGIVYLEANLFGLPAIAGRSGGAIEAVIHDYNGLVVNPLNPIEIAEAISQLIDNPEKSAILANQGISRINQTFQWSIQASKLQQFLGGDNEQSV